MIRYFTVHPTAANLVMAGIMVLGVAALPTLTRETFPDFAPSEVEVRVAFPGATADEVEEVVCQRIEDAVQEIEDLREIRCEARGSQATTVIEMADGADIGRFLSEIRTEVEAIDDFPDLVETPVVRELGRTDRVVAVAITGPMSPGDLEAYAEDVKHRMLRAGIGSKITVEGFALRQIRIELSAERLRALGLGVGDIARAVERQSLDLPTGTITTAERELVLRFADERRRAREVGDLVVVAGPGGGELRLRDIAHIEERFEHDESKVLVDGRRAAVLQVAKSKAQDSLRVMADLEAFLDDERASAPPGVDFALTQDVASIVADRLYMLLENGAAGLVLVLLTMWLFFRLRYALFVALALPVSFLGGLLMMAFFGYSINMITMVALLIAIGLLVDTAIVVSENIATRLQAGRPPADAAVEGLREVAPGVTASFLTTICVFAPLAFLTGQIGKVMAVLPVVLIVVLSVAFLQAFLILPHHLARSARTAEPPRLRRRIDAAFVAVRERGLGPLVDRAVRFRYLTLGLVIGMLLASVGTLAGGILAFRAFPDIDGDVVEARVLLPQGTPLARTERVAERITDALQAIDEELTPLQPDGERLVRHTSVRYGVNPDAFERGPHLVTVTADLLGAERRTVTIDELLLRWREAVGPVPDVISLTYKEPFLGPAGHAIELRLEGADLDELKAASQALQEWLRGYRGVVDVIDDLRPGPPELRLSLREGALALGVDAATIAEQLRAAYFGITAREVQRGRQSLEIDLRLDDVDRSRRGSLDEFVVALPSGAQVPLSVVARIVPDRGWARIHRIDRARTVTVQGDVTAGANAQAIVQDTRARFVPDLERDFPGVAVRIGGQADEAAETGASLARNFLIGLIGIYLLLSFLFRSYLEPIVVMTTIPMALIGVIFGHLAMGLELSMPSMVGFASLAGIVVNNGILVVAFTQRNLERGMSVAEAASQASRDRFRAVLLTTLTTIAGLLPLLAETSLQAQVLIPLVTSLAFGLLSASVLVLFVIPALYVVAADVRPQAREVEVAA